VGAFAFRKSLRQLARTRQKPDLEPTSKRHLAVKFGVASHGYAARRGLLRAARSIQAGDNATLAA
jgi:hypothetical protein